MDIQRECTTTCLQIGYVGFCKRNLSHLSFSCMGKAISHIGMPVKEKAYYVTLQNK